MTVLDRAKRFRPSAVEPFIAGSALEQQTADGWVTVDAPPEADRLPVHDDALRLNVPTCTNAVGVASLACYTSMDAGPNVVYGRYHIEHGTTLLQYWYFYPDDFWSLFYPPNDFIWQAHEGDWSRHSRPRRERPAGLGMPETELSLVHENAPRWLRFQGTWGEGQFIHAPAPLGTIPFGPSPVGPQGHAVWLDPLGTIASWSAG